MNEGYRPHPESAKILWFLLISTLANKLSTNVLSSSFYQNKKRRKSYDAVILVINFLAEQFEIKSSARLCQ